MKQAFEIRLACGLVFATLVLGTAGALSYRATDQFAETGRAVSQRQEFLRELENVLSTVKDAENCELALMLSGDESTIFPISSAVSEVNGRFERLKKLTTGDAEQQQLRQLERDIQLKLDEIRRLPENQSFVFPRYIAGKQIVSRMEKIRGSVSAIVRQESENLRRASEALKVSAKWASTSFLVTAALTFGLVGFVFFRLMRDMRYRRRSMELLQYSEERYRLLAENSLDLITLLDLSGNVIYASPSHERVLRRTPGSLLGNSLTTLVHPEDLAHVRQAVSHLPDSAPGKTVDVRLSTESGQWLETEMLVSSFSISGVSGRRILLSARDVSERRAAQREREKLIQELQEAIAKIKVLSGFIPICSSCKKIRDDQGYWNQLESYIQSHSEAQFSHSICPDCAAVLYPGIFTKGA
jgi:PAS domain S-box-containing protein